MSTVETIGIGTGAKSANILIANTGSGTTMENSYVQLHYGQDTHSPPAPPSLETVCDDVVTHNLRPIITTLVQLFGSFFLQADATWKAENKRVYSDVRCMR